MTDTTTCPECGQRARVEERFVLESTDGPTEHCRIRCGSGHWFLLSVELLARSHRTAPATRSEVTR